MQTVKIEVPAKVYRGVKDMANEPRWQSSVVADYTEANIAVGKELRGKEPDDPVTKPEFVTLYNLDTEETATYECVRAWQVTSGYRPKMDQSDKPVSMRTVNLYLGGLKSDGSEGKESRSTRKATAKSTNSEEVPS